MHHELTVEEALERADILFVDVRSPGEFAQASVPGAVNIPLFNDEERRQLGIIYHAEGEAAARRTALTLVSPKLPALVAEIETAAKNAVPLLYCWRGGLRSLSLYHILYLVGAPVFRLKGGYRAYRRFVNRRLGGYCLTSKLLVLHGLTGVGKTSVIHELNRRGLPAIDLEGLARHRGSAFGSVGLAPQRSQKDFEALLLNELERVNGASYIAVEGEGSRIGNIHLPPFLVRAMDEGDHLLLTAPLAERVRRIVSDYLPPRPSAADLEQIRNSVISLRWRLGAQRTEKLLNHLEAGDYAAAAETLCLEYYDRLYGDARAGEERYASVIDSTDIHGAANRVAAYLSVGSEKLAVGKAT